MSTQFVGTFGVRYKNEPHPSGLPVDPDGYILIHAKSYHHAVALMQARYGGAYAFIYSKADFETPNALGRDGHYYHPHGVTAELGRAE